MQSFLWDGNTLFTMYRIKKYAKDAYLCQTAPDKRGAYSIDQSKALKMIGFSHGQSLERFTVKKNNKTYKKYMMCGDATSDGWATSVVFLNESAIKNKQGAEKEYKYSIANAKKITGLNYVGSYNGAVKRLDAAISTDGSTLAVWCEKKNYAKRVISLYNMNVIKDYLYVKGNNTYSLSSAKLRNAALITRVELSETVAQPNKSFQSMELSNAFGTKKNNWRVYITSGNQGIAGKKTTITRLTISKGNKWSNHRMIQVKIPVNSAGKKVINTTAEIEGCHIQGSELHFLMTPSKDSKNGETKSPAKTWQYIMSVSKSIFNNKAAER